MYMVAIIFTDGAVTTGPAPSLKTARLCCVNASYFDDGEFAFKKAIIWDADGRRVGGCGPHGAELMVAK